MPGDAATAVRLFLALWPDDPAREALCRWREGWQWPAGAALVPAERLHLTLHFIGSVPAARLPEVERGLAVPCAPFGIVFDRAESWPRGLAVLAAQPAVPAELAVLRRRLAVALQGLALPVEPRPWRPHVTLARHAGGAVPPADGPDRCWSVSAYALVQSQGGYRTLRRYPAAAGR